MTTALAKTKPDSETEPDAEALAPQPNTGNTVRASWPVSLDAVRANLAHCSAEGREAVIKAFCWCIDPRHQIHKTEFARRVHLSDNTIYRIITGTYKNPETGEKYDVPVSLIKAIREFMRMETERWAGGGMGFIETPTARKCARACDLARESQTPVFLSGPSHIGKTWALQHYKDTNNHGRTFYARVRAASGLGGMVRRVADSCGISDRSNTAKLIDRIKRALTPDTVMILDEVHQLAYTYRISSFFACMEVLREIYDEAQCGMVLCGTTLMLESMKSGSHNEMEQFMRRGVHRISLPMAPTKDDLTAILHFHHLELPAKTARVTCFPKTTDEIEEVPYELLRMLAKSQGLKAITERLRYGVKIAGKAGSKVSWRTFCEAHLRISKESVEVDDWAEGKE